MFKNNVSTDSRIQKAPPLGIEIGFTPSLFSNVMELSGGVKLAYHLNPIR